MVAVVVAISMDVLWNLYLATAKLHAEALQPLLKGQISAGGTVDHC
jgi:hypothetical protein